MENNPNTASSQPLLDYFNRLIPLSHEEQELVRARFHPHLFLKKQFALQHGDICEYFYFVVRGCLRLYMVDDKGVYHISRFVLKCLVNCMNLVRWVKLLPSLSHLLKIHL